MSEASGQPAKDWVGNIRAYALAWGVPSLAIIAGSLADTPARSVIWSVALIWMGAACLANAARCGRLHCYFTGPFFLVMAVVVLLHGFGLFTW